jgi:hypothetical protein
MSEAKQEFPVVDVDGLDLAFGGDMKKLMPPMAAIPDEFKDYNTTNKWLKFQSDWFFYGIKNHKMTPKPGIDAQKALRHMAAIQQSWETQHEHKSAGVAYLASLWFDDITYDKVKP